MSENGKIQQLNFAIHSAVPLMQQEAESNPNASVFVRAVKFSDGAQWHISQPTPIEQFRWMDLTAGGVTDMGKAFELVAEQLSMPPMSDRALPPVLVLISDGCPTDEYMVGLRRLLDQPWGKKAVRIAIAIGGDADKDVLQRFIGHAELKPLQANNAEDLVKYIKWVSTAVLKSSSAPNSQVRADGSSLAVTMHVPLPQVPKPGPASAADVW